MLPVKEEVRQLELLLQTLEAENSLYEFIKQAWSSIEGNTPFIDNWHIQAIAEHLEACYRRDIKNLLINMPPRAGKTNLISISFPAWVWLHNPSEQFLYSSYAKRISSDQSKKCKTLIESPWYQERWGHIFQLSKDQHAKDWFSNNKLGHRVSTSIGAATTAIGGDILVLDDPNSADDQFSLAVRESTNQWVDQVWSTRRNNPKTSVNIIVQQRLHESDVTGRLMSDDNWVKLIIPMEFESARKSKTIILPSTNGKVWEDPRTKEGELLCYERWSEKELQEYKNTLTPYGYACQYQQRVAPPEGGLIKKNWFKWWKHPTPPDIEFVLQSWDTAFTSNELSAFSACTTWGVFYDDNNIENVILLSMWRGKLDAAELREIMQRLYFDYRDNAKVHNPKFTGRPVDMCLVEAKASGIHLIQDLAAAGIKAIPFNPDKYGKKIPRVNYVAPLIECGRVWLPAKPPLYDKLLNYADEFLTEMISFPNADSLDLVDTMTQALIKLKTGQFLSHARDVAPEPDSYNRITAIY